MINSQQTITGYQECRSEHSGWSENAVRDYQGKFNDIQELLSLINNGAFSPIVSTGSPEGVIVSNYSLKYIDSSVPTEYYNPNFGVNTGWIAL